LVTDGYNRESVIGNGPNNADKAYDDTSQGFFDDDYPDTIADVAMHYYQGVTPATTFANPKPVPTPAACKTDPPLRLDCQTTPHMVTYGITLGQPGTIYKNPAAG